MRFRLVKMKGVRDMHSIESIFTKEKTDKVQTITTLEIAEMMETPHYEILRKLEGTTNADGSTKQIGIIPVLTDGKIPVSDYFSVSAYKDASGKENRCYNVTKIGCDFLANKFTGEKGILFTARYVKRFDEMEKQIKNNTLPTTYRDAVAQLLESLDREEELKEQIDKSKDWYSIKRVAALNGVSWKTFKWRRLKEVGEQMGYEVKKIFDANYGEVNTYHREVWEEAYPDYEI